MVGALVLAAAAAPWLTPYDPDAIVVMAYRGPMGPGNGHLFGTDTGGRDIRPPPRPPARPRRAAGRPRARRARHVGRDHRRRRSVLPRPRGPAADTVVGSHGERRADLRRGRALAGRRARRGDRPRRGRVEPDRLRPHRSARRAAGMRRASLAALVLLTACAVPLDPPPPGEPDGAGPPRAGGVLRGASPEDPRTLDPARGYDTVSWAIEQMLFNTLVD